MGKRSSFERSEDQHIFRLTSTEIARSDRILKNRLGVVGRQVCDYSLGTFPVVLMVTDICGLAHYDIISNAYEDGRPYHLYL